VKNWEISGEVQNKIHQETNVASPNHLQRANSAKKKNHNKKPEGSGHPAKNKLAGRKQLAKEVTQTARRYDNRIFGHEAP